MTSQERLALLLKEFGEHIGLPHFTLNSNEPTTLVFNDNIVVNFELSKNEKNLVLFSSFPEVNIPNEVSEKSHSMYKKLLNANLFWRDTGGATIGVTAENTAIAAYQTPLSAIDPHALEFLLDAFVSNLIKVQDMINDPDLDEGIDIANSMTTKKEHLIMV